MSDNHSLEPGKWIERYADYLYSYTLMRINKKEVAEDLVQDTFFSAWKAKDTFLHNASEKTWLVSILKRKIIDYYRKKSTQSELSILDNDSKNKAGDHFFDGTGPTEGHWTEKAAPKEWGKDFETGVETDEFRDILQNCLGKLPEKAAAVFTLKNMEDMDSKEICKELQITPSNYWILMHRAKLQLRECMEKNWINK